MDKALIRSRFAKASGSYLGQATVQRGIALRMADLIGQYVPVEITEAQSWILKGKLAL